MNINEIPVYQAGDEMPAEYFNIIISKLKTTKLALDALISSLAYTYFDEQYIQSLLGQVSDLEERINNAHNTLQDANQRLEALETNTSNL